MQALATLIDSAGRVFHSLDGRTLDVLVILGFYPVVLKVGKQGIKSYQSDFVRESITEETLVFDSLLY